MSEETPKLYVFAGPNGSGKSTITNKLYHGTDELPKKYINADDIKKENGYTDLEAAEEATQQRKEALERGESFTFETVMSMPDKIDLLKEAKSRNYEIHFYYITTQNPAINIDRVQERYEKGGHFVPPEKVTERYERSMKLLPKALRIVDYAEIYNNSFENPKLIIEKSKERGIEVHPQGPPSIWTKEKLENFIGISNSDKVTSEKVPDVVRLQKSEDKFKDHDS